MKFVTAATYSSSLFILLPPNICHYHLRHLYSIRLNQDQHHLRQELHPCHMQYRPLSSTAKSLQPPLSPDHRGSAQFRLSPTITTLIHHHLPSHHPQIPHFLHTNTLVPDTLQDPLLHLVHNCEVKFQ